MTYALEDVVPWGRGLTEYERMFALAEADLVGPILGCADGPASFNAEATARGACVISCDPLYQFPAHAIAARIDATRPAILASLASNRDAYVWQEFSTPEAVAVARTTAMTRFRADYQTRGAQARYIAAALPTLPFGARTFRLALCSHLLFLYSTQLPEDFHLAAAHELCRVAHEVRIFPLVGQAGAPSPFVGPVTESLRRAGHQVDGLRVPYEFQRGGNQMLRIKTRAPAA